MGSRGGSRGCRMSATVGTNESHPKRILSLDISVPRITNTFPALCRSFRRLYSFIVREHVHGDYCTPGMRVATAYAISTLSPVAIYQRRKSFANALTREDEGKIKETRICPVEDARLVATHFESVWRRGNLVQRYFSARCSRRVSVMFASAARYKR